MRGTGWKLGICAAALALAGPSFAAQSAPVAATSLTATSPVAGSVGVFYSVRQDAPVWFRAGTEDAPARLSAILRRATIDGLSVGPRLADEVDAATARAKTGDKAAIAEADRVLSIAWVIYVQKLRSPTPGMSYADRSVRPTPPQPYNILRDAAGAPSLGDHLDQASSVNPLYAALRDAALKEAGASASLDSRVATNLDRVRAIPGTGRFIVVDAAGARLWMYENGRPVDSMKVIVGTNETPTPMIASMMSYATLNPYWHVPDNLARKTIAPNVLKMGKGYLKARGYQIVSAWRNDAEILSPDSVDWKGVAAGTVEVKIRQLPGGDNSMGQMKFPFPNGEGIYLHDTPSKDKFLLKNRALSNGCIRLEDAPRLARWLLGAPPQATSDQPDLHVQLPKSVPIYVTYITAQPVDGKVTYLNDVYGRDGTAAARVAVAR